MEKLNRTQKCSILGPQNLGSRGGAGPPAPPLDPHLLQYIEILNYSVQNVTRVASVANSTD